MAVWTFQNKRNLRMCTTTGGLSPCPRCMNNVEENLPCASAPQREEAILTKFTTKLVTKRCLSFCTSTSGLKQENGIISRRGAGTQRMIGVVSGYTLYGRALQVAQARKDQPSFRFGRPFRENPSGTAVLYRTS